MGLFLERDAMDVLWLELGCLENHRNNCNIDRIGHDKVRDLVNINKFETTTTMLKARSGRCVLIKLGNINDTPITWNMHLDNSRRACPPAKS